MGRRPIARRPQAAPRPPSPAMIAQQGIPPFKMTCHVCEHEWIPEGRTRDGSITEYMLDKSAKDHWKACKGPPARSG